MHDMIPRVFQHARKIAGGSIIINVHRVDAGHEPAHERVLHARQRFERCARISDIREMRGRDGEPHMLLHVRGFLERSFCQLRRKLLRCFFYGFLLRTRVPMR